MEGMSTVFAAKVRINDQTGFGRGEALDRHCHKAEIIQPGNDIPPPITRRYTRGVSRRQLNRATDLIQLLPDLQS